MCGKRWIALLGLACLIGAAVWAQDDPRSLLTQRTARWEHEANLESDKETFGAEHNPTGNPIGGGEWYKDIITRGDYTVRTFDELRDALGKAREGQVVFIPGDYGGRAELTVTED